MIFTEIQLAFKSVKVVAITIAIVAFALLLLFTGNMPGCRKKPEPPPVVTVIQSVPIETAILPEVIENVDRTVIEVQKKEEAVKVASEKKKKALVKKIRVVQDSPTETETSRAEKIGEIQVHSLWDAYHEYYPPSPDLSGVPA